MAFMNMVNSIIGAGIVSQPIAMRNCGLVGGCIIMVLLTFLVDWTLRLIVFNAQLSNTRSYQDTVQHCFGRTGRFFFLLTISSFAYGGCIAFCVIIGDTIPHVLRLFLPASMYEAGMFFAPLLLRNSIIALFTVGMSYPLSLHKDISRLAGASSLALVGMVIIVAITLLRAPFVSVSLRAPLTRAEWLVNSNMFQGISFMSFALVCHHNTLFIFHSMRNATVARFATLTHVASAVSLCFCLLMGALGLLNFGHNVKGNILNNFSANDPWMNVARFCFGMNMLTTFPLEIFVVRDVLKDIVAPAHIPGALTELTDRQHVLITTFLVFSSMSVSLFTCNLGMILELIGATAALLMSYIIPPLCYVQLSFAGFDYHAALVVEKRAFMFRKLVPSVLCVLFGVFIMVVSSYMTLRTSLASSGENHCVDD